MSENRSLRQCVECRRWHGDMKNLYCHRCRRRRKKAEALACGDEGAAARYNVYICKNADAIHRRASADEMEARIAYYAERAAARRPLFDPPFRSA